MLCKLPMYRMVKRLSGSLLGREAVSFAPALLLDADGRAEAAYLVDELAAGRVSVLLSMASSVPVVASLGGGLDELAAGSEGVSPSACSAIVAGRIGRSDGPQAEWADIAPATSNSANRAAS